MSAKERRPADSDLKVTQSAALTCNACGAAVSSGQRFCGICGGKLARTCSKCGAENLLNHQFCGGCGARLEKANVLDQPEARAKGSVDAVVREERRWATLLFADLSGFTKMSEQLDPEDVKALAHSCTQRLGEEVVRFGGTVITIAGDQVVGAFGAPVTHEDDAERAVRAALAMRDCPLQDKNGGPIQIHVGLNTGEVMAGLIGPQEHQDYAVMGNTTNVAARLMGLAPAGSVLVGEETWRATREVVKYRELPPVPVKGKQLPVPVWEALEVVAEPKSRPLGTAPLVGRDEELVVLSGIWLRVVREGRPHLVTVLGEPGLGKSRLAIEFEKRFCVDARVVHGRCLPYGEALSYSALSTALREAMGLTAELESAAGRAQLDRFMRGVLTGEAEGDVAEIIRHLALVSAVDTAEDRTGKPVDERTLHGSVRRFLESLARQKPLCWMVEDIHWGDDALLDLIEHVAGRSKEAPLLILTQARPGLLEKRPNWGAGLRGFTSLSLEVLNLEDGHELVSALCRERGLAEAVADEVGRGAGGNPLFAEELVAMIVERGRTSGVPSAIKALIASRLDALPREERSTLQLAAVFGKAFWVGGLRALGADSEVLDQLERLEHKDLLRSQPRSQFRNEKEFVFKHDLIRDVAYGMLPRAERRPLHGKIADWIQHAAGDAVESYLDQLAHHAVSAGQEERALGFLSDAAERARQVAAHRQEAALLTQAVGIAEHLGKPECAGEFRARRGCALDRVGLWGEARPELEAALRQLPQNADARRAEVHVTLASVCFWLLDLPSVLQQVAKAKALAERAGRADIAGNAMGWLGAVLQAEGETPKAIEAFEQSIAQPDTSPAAQASYPLSLYLLGRSADSLAAARGLFSRLRSSADTVAAMYGFPHIGLALAANGKYAEALSTFEDSRRYGQNYQNWRFLARAIAISAGFHQDIGDFAGNEALNEEAREMARTHDFVPTIGSAGIDLLLNYARRHEVGRAEGLIEPTEREINETGNWHRWLWKMRFAEARAEIAYERGNWNEALSWAQDAITQSQAKPRPKYEALGLWTRGRALDALGRRHEAIADVKQALTIARRVADPALFLRLVATLLDFDGTDDLLKETRATAQRIAAELPEEMRGCFERVEVVQKWKLLRG